MSADVYNFLERIGFHHPLHPAFAHIPMGMVVGSFIFLLLSVLIRKSALRTTSLHCTLLAFFSLFLAAATGIMDFQHRWGGEMEPSIKAKIILAGVLAVLLLMVLFLHAIKASKGKLLFLLFLCLLCVAGIGYFGGELVYGV